MKRYCYTEPDEKGKPHLVIKTEQEILAEYWPYWAGRMKELGRGPITREACLEDWIVVNWAAPYDGPLA